MSELSIQATEKQLVLLENLAGELAERTSQIPLAAQQIIKNALPDLMDNKRSQQLPAYIQLGVVKLHWELFIEHRKNQIVFFFFKRKKAFDNSLQTNISMSIRPVQRLSPTPFPTLVHHYWLPPISIELAPATALAREVRQNNPNKNKTAHTLWLRLGPTNNDLLAIVFRNQIGQSKLFFFKNGQSSNQSPINAKQAPLLWYEWLLVAIRSWIAGQTDAPRLINLRQSAGEIQTILRILSGNFSTISQKMEEHQQAHEKTNTAWKKMVPYYQIADYEANIRFRLNDAGEVPKEVPASELETVESLQKKEDLFQLKVSLNAFRKNNQQIIHFKILPPDFLIEGPFFNAFLQELQQPKATKNLQKYLKKASRKLNISSKIFQEALAAAQSGVPDAFVFRIQRGRKFDTQMFVLPLPSKSKSKHLFFAAKFEVDASKQTVRLKEKSLENLLESSNGQFELKNQGVRYFMRLLSHINQWKNKVI